MTKALIVGLGGFVGAVARYWLSGLIHRTWGNAFPFGTLVVNVLGCFAIGVLFSLAEERELLSPHIRLLFMIGLLGSFTTFSALGLETFSLLHAGAMGTAALYILASLGLGLGAVALGRALVQIL